MQLELFAPENFPGVGMGDLQSIVAICGLLGLAVTSGVLLAEGAIGTLVFAISALAVLQDKPDLGGGKPAAVAVLLYLLLAVAARRVLELRARRESAQLAGSAADSPETRAVRRASARRESLARGLAIVSVALGGAVTGVAWAEWNEVPFRLGDTESWVGLAIGFVAAAIGGDAAWRFLHGAIRAGGSATIVGTVVCVGALALNAASVYVPFVGVVVFGLTAVLAVRLRQRQRQKYAGLRILS